MVEVINICMSFYNLFHVKWLNGIEGLCSVTSVSFFLVGALSEGSFVFVFFQPRSPRIKKELKQGRKTMF